jgi:hypothetical protein
MITLYARSLIGATVVHYRLQYLGWPSGHNSSLEMAVLLPHPRQYPASLARSTNAGRNMGDNCHIYVQACLQES